MKMKTKPAITGSAMLITGMALILLMTRPESHAAEPDNKPDNKNPLAHVSGIYRALSAFDTDKNKKIEGAENTNLTNAISEDTLKLPDLPKAPLGMKPPAGMLAGRLTKAHATLAPYDKNSNGDLDDAELEQLQSDRDAGKVTLPLPHSKK